MTAARTARKLPCAAAAKRSRVAICTASAYQFALRKIFEATAAGCRVITDLTAHDYLPEIDGNLTRVSPDVATGTLRGIVDELAATWDLATQTDYAAMACARYDYRVEGARVATLLERAHRERVA